MAIKTKFPLSLSHKNTWKSGTLKTKMHVSTYVYITKQANEMTSKFGSFLLKLNFH